MGKLHYKQVGKSPDGKPIISVSSQPNVSKENKTEYGNAKRVKELSRQGYNNGAIRAMMGESNFSSRKIEKMRREKHVTLDGKV